jgi:predicted amidohydrolase
MTHKVAGIQMTSGHDVAHNLAVAKGLIQQAVDCGATLIVLPEMFAVMGLDQMDKVKYRESFGMGQIQDFLVAQAAQHGIWLVGGTIPITVPGDNNKIRAACLVFDDQGQCAGRYDKIHLFDVTLQAHQEIYNESKTTDPGSEIVVIQTPMGRLGLAVCYDVRFPELFRAMLAKNVEIVALPSAFTYVTGSVHWDILIRARAIENQIYMIAAAQTGVHSNTRKTYGNSMVVNAWGEVQAQLDEQVGVVVSEVNLENLQKIRQNFPALLHRKL